eukprot:GHVN01042368.1.p1 GENE.GHVN01042368.1~~GHVN01042368.1.p1  ORF type:complete len:184 (-),score=29.60 GHVN01042368.1:16-567(-)
MARKTSIQNKKTRAEMSMNSDTLNTSRETGTMRNALSAIKSRIEKKEDERSGIVKGILDKTCNSVSRLVESHFGKDGSDEQFSRKIKKMREEQAELVKKFKGEMKKRRGIDQKLMDQWNKIRKGLERAMDEFEQERGKEKSHGASIKKEILKETAGFQNKAKSQFAGRNSLKSLKRSLNLLLQ